MVKPMVRALFGGLLLSVVGFTYALATSRSLEESIPSVSSRVVGSAALRFTNVALAAPLVSFDLGDGAWGSVMTRYITVTGGIRPYKYTGQTALESLIRPNSSLKLTASGAIMGSVAIKSTLDAPGFPATVTDSLGTSPRMLIGGFVLNMQVGSFNVFRFAMDKINNGVLGQTYISKLETVGGSKPVIFSVIPGTLTVNGKQIGVGGGLEPIGLSLGADGTIFGRPLLSGLVTFQARATDVLKRTATARYALVPSGQLVSDQTISFNVEDSSVSATDAMLLSCSIKCDTGISNNDTLQFSGVINTSGDRMTALSGGNFALRIGGASYAGTFDPLGKAVSVFGGPLIYTDGTRLSLSVNPQTGVIKGGLSRASLAHLIGADTLQDGDPKRLGFTLSMLDYEIHCDSIQFATRVKGSKTALDYSLSKSGQPNGGAFQLLSVYGQDGTDIAGNRGDAWRASFLMIPRFGVDSTAGLDAVNRVTVRIGSKFVQMIPSSSLITSSKGGITLKPNKTQSPVVSQLQIDPRKFTGIVQTNVISQFVTGIPQASASADFTTNPLVNFTMAIDVDRTGSNADFSGEYGKRLFLPIKGAGANPIGASKRQNHWVDQAQLR